MYKDDSMQVEVQGSNLDNAATKSDYVITVGANGECTVTQLTSSQLLCRLPSREPKRSEKSRGREHAVTVNVGNVAVDVGYVRYYNSIIDNPVYLSLIIICSILGFVLLVGVPLAIKFKLWTRFKCCKTKQKNVTGTSFEMTHSSEQGEASAAEEEALPLLLARLEGDLRASVKEQLIDAKHLKIGDQIGKGNFGKVYKGTLTHRRKPVECAVKTLKGMSTCTVFV